MSRLRITHHLGTHLELGSRHLTVSVDLKRRGDLTD